MLTTRSTPAFLAAALIAALLSPSKTPAAEAPADNPPVFIGYVYGSIDGIRYDMYTHLCHAFVVAGEDGNIKPNRRAPSGELTKRAHEYGVKVLLSLGGWGWDKQFAAIVADGAAEDRYVDAVLKMVADFDYDGIDLDWEYPDSAEEVPGFERLSKRLRAGLDKIAADRGQPMLLTMAVSASPRTLRWLNSEFLLATMDWINVMTYDYTGDWAPQATHNAPLHASSKVSPDAARSIEATMNYLLDERKFPTSRVTLGLPLYGRGFAVGEPYAPTAGAPKSRFGGDYSRIHKLLSGGGWQRRWDDETKTPWLIADDGKHVVGYDDEESLKLKTTWAMERGLRGVFFWEISADRLDDGSTPLQQATHDAWVAGMHRDATQER